MNLYRCIIIHSLLRKVLADILVSVPKMWPTEMNHNFFLLTCTSETDKYPLAQRLSVFRQPMFLCSCLVIQSPQYFP